MRVTVQLFARLRDIAGAAEVSCEVAAGATVADVWRETARQHPGLDAFRSSVSCARNDDFSQMRAPVSDGDVIAFLPPVSGGARS